jgi:taurine dioxygenase
MKFTVRRLGALGAEISGTDGLDRLSDQEISELRALWLEHLVLFFRKADLSPGQLLTFARRFGEPMEYPYLKDLAEAPFVTEVIKRAHETQNFGGVWHSDTSYMPEPPMATMLIGRVVPPFGGDTLFANGYLAYETLSPGMKRFLDSARVVNASGAPLAIKTRENVNKSAQSEFLSEHPAARTHPETGRKSLYVNPAHSIRFADMTEEESAPILAYLFSHQVRPEFTCRFSWDEGTLAFWDNRCALHNPVNDYHGYERVMHRVTIKGDRPT